MENRIYLDYAASTPLSSDVYKSMLDCFSSTFGNASSIHHFGRVAADKLEESRAIVAKAINAKARDTSTNTVEKIKSFILLDCFK